MIFKSVEDLLAGKDLHVLSEQDNVQHACRLMAKHNKRAICVTNGGQLKGIISEKDVVQKCIALSKSPATTTLKEVMTQNVSVIQSKDSVAHAIATMADGGFHHLPVIKDEKLIGMIYSDDIPEEYKLLLEHYKELRG